MIHDSSLREREWHKSMSTSYELLTEDYQLHRLKWQCWCCTNGPYCQWAGCCCCCCCEVSVSMTGPSCGGRGVARAPHWGYPTTTAPHTAHSTIQTLETQASHVQMEWPLALSFISETSIEATNGVSVSARGLPVSTNFPIFDIFSWVLSPFLILNDDSTSLLSRKTQGKGLGK